MPIHLYLTLFSIFNVLNGQNVWNLPNILSPECNETTADLINECNTDSYIKWHSQDLILDQDTRSCCHTWDVTSCLVLIVEAKCGRVDLQIADQYFTEVNQQLDLTFCGPCVLEHMHFKEGVTQKEKIEFGRNWLYQAPREDPYGDLPECTKKNDPDAVCNLMVANRYLWKPTPSGPEYKHKMNCCRIWVASDCILEESQMNELCTHEDIVRLTRSLRNWRKNQIKLICPDYPHGSTLCQESNLFILNNTLDGQNLV